MKVLSREDNYDYRADREMFLLNNDIDAIGEYAFCGFDKLTRIILPTKLKEIGRGAFEGCSNLGNIEIPSNVEYIAPYAFMGCNKLESIVIPGTVHVFDASSFTGCSSLEKIVIENGTQEIMMKEFRGCNNLKLISIPAGLFFKKYDDYDEYLGDDFEKMMGENLLYAVTYYKLRHSVSRDEEFNFPNIKIRFGGSFNIVVDCNKFYKVYSNIDFKIFDSFQKMEKLVEVTNCLYHSGTKSLKTNFQTYKDFEEFAKKVTFKSGR